MPRLPYSLQCTFPLSLPLLPTYLPTSLPLPHLPSPSPLSPQTREELREALENEIRSFTVDKDLFGNAELSWNHIEFEVQYECLSEEIKIGDYYLRLLLEEGGSTKFSKP